MKDLSKALRSEKIQNLTLGTPLTASKDTPLGQVIDSIKKERRSYAVILDGRRVVGIFTDRDIMLRVVEQKPDGNTPIAKLMTPDPAILKAEDSVADAVQLMNQGGYRHAPIVNGQGELMGVIGVRDLIRYLAEHFPSEVYNLPPDPRQVISAPEGA